MTPAPPATWEPHWLAASTRPLARSLWRGVEAQHRVATMKLTDTLDEQLVLEQLLESSKPPLPAGSQSMSYLIHTPFRYRSAHPSRFRAAHDAGLWYGAESLPTACAEVGYWRWRFVMDSDGLRERQLVTEHTFFLARARGTAIDLTAAPWASLAARWTDPSDYGDCQRLAAQARQAGVGWIRYRSVRHPAGYCGAVLDPAVLSLSRPLNQQTWTCRAGRAGVVLVHDSDHLALRFDDKGLPRP